MTREQAFEQLKWDEERLLRTLDTLRGLMAAGSNPVETRWFDEGRMTLETGFMQIRRGIMRPARSRLPEDDNGA